MFSRILLLVTGLLFSSVYSRRTDYTKRALKDEITSLPGLSSDILADYTMFSGYITVNESHGRKLFYWFVESLNNPVNDSVALWTNGGPGCSGLGGFFTEQGPFRPNENLTLYVNKYSWVNIANMIFIEQPSGVGFSYSNTESDYTTGDNTSASDNYEFIKQWLTLFPNYQKNNFYITSESYGGHYMPTLARKIVEGNNAGGSPQVNFKGFFVGNPYTDPVENAIGQYATWFGHQLVALPTYLRWQKDCVDGTDFNSPKCDLADLLMSEDVGDNVDPYALDFPTCTRTNEPGFDSIKYMDRFWFVKRVLHEGLGRPLPKLYIKLFKEYDLKISEIELKNEKLLKKLESNNNINSQYKVTDEPFDFPPDNYHPCESNYMTEYLNEKKVQNAIHAYNKTIWTMCSAKVNYSNDDMFVYMESYYNWLILNAPDLHITIVSGDDDSVCGSLGTQSWIWNMGWTVNHDYNWNAWEYNGQVSGYHTKWTNGVSLVTVHSAGHMIPETQPAKSLEAFRRYLAGSF